MARSSFIPLAVVSLFVLGACGASFAETFPSPRRSPRPAVVGTSPAPAPATYAGAPTPLYAPPSYYYAEPAGTGPAGATTAPEEGPATTWDRPIPEPPAPSAPAARCENSCDLAHNGECDDGRESAGSDLCMPGTDCADCGA